MCLSLSLVGVNFCGDERAKNVVRESLVLPRESKGDVSARFYLRAYGINFFFGCIFSVVCVQYYKRVSSPSLSVVPYVFVLLLMMMFWFSSSSSSFSSTCFSKGEE